MVHCVDGNAKENEDMDKWKKASPELGKLLEAAVTPFPSQKKMMFGAPVWTVGGNMFAGVRGDNIFIRLPEADRRRIAAEVEGAVPFEPIPGRTMAEYVTIPPTLYLKPTELHHWLKRSHEYVQSLAPKKPKKKTSAPKGA
jgi:TfoX/Sxy family transcriptional regulator of competence genes